MAFESEDQKAAAIEQGVRTDFWQEYLLPALQSRAKNVLEKLAATKSDDEDIKRGWFQALRWVIALPEMEIQTYRKEAESRIAEQKLVDLDNYRAEVGFRSPFPSQPAPGDLKNSEDRPTPSSEEM